MKVRHIDDVHAAGVSQSHGARARARCRTFVDRFAHGNGTLVQGETNPSVALKAGGQKQHSIATYPNNDGDNGFVTVKSD